MSIRGVLRILSLAALVAILYAALAFTLTGLTERNPGANDFLSRWVGARALFLHGENPYSDDVTREIQLTMSGQLANAGEDQVAFAYPAYAAFVAAPLVGLPYPQAQALWMSLLIILVVAGVLILARLSFLRMTPWLLTVLVIGVLMFYPAVRGIFLGQYALVSFFFLVLGLLALEARQDLLAGALVALATVKPQALLFFAPALLFWTVRQRRWRFSLGMAGMLAALIGGATLFVPGWIGDFVRGLFAYSEYARIGPPLQTFIELVVSREWSSTLTFAIGAALIAWMIVALWRARDADWEDLKPALSVIAIVTALTAVRIGTPDQIILLIPLAQWLKDWTSRRQIWLAVVVTSIWLLLPWAVFAMTLKGNAEDTRVTIVLPLLAIATGLMQGIKHAPAIGVERMKAE